MTSFVSIVGKNMVEILRPKRKLAKPAMKKGDVKKCLQ